MTKDEFTLSDFADGLDRIAKIRDKQHFTGKIDREGSMKKMPTSVAHTRRHAKGLKTTFVGRPSEFGNPYKISLKDGNRRQVISKFFHGTPGHPGFKDDKVLQRKAKRLKGRTLLCWCTPYNCHGTILAMFADGKSLRTIAMWIQKLPDF